MAAVSIRNLDDAVVEVIRARAAKHHRSFEGELRFILEQAARKGTDSSPPPPVRIEVVHVPVDHSYGREVLYDESDS